MPFTDRTIARSTHTLAPGRAQRAPAHAQSHPAMPWLLATAVIISLGNLLGWVTGTRWLVSVSPGLPSMVPITALLALTTSAGLWSVFRHPARSWQAVLGPAALLLVTIAIEWFYLRAAAPAPLLLARSGVETPLSLSSAMTTQMFFLLGCAQLLLAVRRLVAAAQGLALAVFFVALLNLGGYLLQETFLFQMLPNKGTSILTTAVIMTLAMATLLTESQTGLMAAVTGDLPGARASRRLLLSAFLVPLLAGAAIALGMRFTASDAETMLIVFVWLVIVFFLVVVWRMALQLAASDQERAQAQHALQHAVQQLQAEHQHKDMFMATLAHELRNPLAPISAAGELLKRGGGTTEADRIRLADIIAAQSTSLVTLVNDLMDVERLNTGRLVLDKQPVDVRRAIGRAVEQVAPMLNKHGHQYALDLPIVPICVCGDYHRLTQVFANLLANAAKYTAPGGRIHISTALSDTHAAITVTDNGHGMNQQLLARLFEPYVQAQITPNRADGGLGLGLALVKKLTELHGGTVAASSAGLGHGSHFTVTLPLIDAPSTSPHGAAAQP